MDTKPPIFRKAVEPLYVEEWINTREATEPLDAEEWINTIVDGR
jgi:hypothetical protein